jgi:hypothetical protein
MPLTATSGAVDIPDGVYPDTVLNIALTPATANSPNQDPFLKWTICVYATPDGVEMAATSSTRFSAKAKTRQWVESILDRRFEVGEQFDYETFGPIDCQVVVKRDENGFCRIEAITGVSKRPPARPAVPASGPAPGGPAGVTV